MQKCLQLAEKGLGKVAPNPMVGCVVVKDGEIIGEGYHEEFGENHAEVNAIESVKDNNLLKGAELYVNLEPCTHHGKTPPCVDRILESNIGKVIIAGQDPNIKVHGKGIAKLKKAGVQVETEVLNIGEKILNRRFRTFHEKKRPYIILKWAESADGFMDIDRSDGEKGQFKISNQESQELLHKWRAEEQAILIGTNTALNDNPSMTVRLVEGRNPLRLVLDLNGRLSEDLKLFTDGNKTVLYSNVDGFASDNVERIIVEEGKNVIYSILNDLFIREIQSVIVEGGNKLLTSFIDAELWDEARVFKSEDKLVNGLKAPKLNLDSIAEEAVGDNTYHLFMKSE